MSKLDQEEKEILDAFESGKLKSVPNKESELKRHKEYAAATFKKISVLTFAYRSEILRRSKSVL